MWPEHCIQGTHGSCLHKDLKAESSDIVSCAGCNPQYDSYSAFLDSDRETYTDLKSSIEERNVTEIYAAGLATDYCVKMTVLDAVQLFLKTDIFVIEDACKGIYADAVQKTYAEFET